MRSCPLFFSMVLLLSGCSGDRKEAPPHTVKAELGSRGNVEKVIAWAEKGGIYVSTGAIHSTTGIIVDPPLTIDWVHEGRRIPDAEEILLSLLMNEDERLAPLLAVQGLGYVGTSKSVPVLAALMDNHEHHELRMIAAWSLAELALPECIAPLANVFSNGSESTVRFYAAQGLAKIPDANAVEVLRQEMARQQEQLDRITAALDRAEERFNAPKAQEMP